MRFVVISPQYSKNHWSAMGRATAELAQHLFGAGGNAVTVYCAKARQGATSVFRDCGVEVVALGSPGGADVTSPRGLLYEEAPQWNEQIKEHWEMRRREYDVIILQDWMGISAGNYIKMRTGGKTVLMVRTFSNGPGGYVPFGSDELGRVYREDETLAIKSVDMRVTMFRRIAQAAEMYTGCAVEFVKGGADVSSGLRRASAREQGALLMVGKLSREKGYERVIRALPRLTWATLTIAGGGSGSSYGMYLRNLAKMMDVEERVIFTGSVSMAELKGLYARASMVVCPNLFDGYGYGLFDAVGMKIPVVAYSPSYSDYIEDGKTGKTFQSLGELVDAVEFVYRNPAVAAKMADAAEEEMRGEEDVSRDVAELMSTQNCAVRA